MELHTFSSLQQLPGIHIVHSLDNYVVADIEYFKNILATLNYHNWEEETRNEFKRNTISWIIKCNISVIKSRFFHDTYRISNEGGEQIFLLHFWDIF